MAVAPTDGGRLRAESDATSSGTSRPKEMILNVRSGGNLLVSNLLEIDF